MTSGRGRGGRGFELGVRHLIAFAVLSVGTGGCGKFLGVDYEVSDGCGSGTVQDSSGKCITVRDCAADELPTLSGGCTAIGAATDRCAAGAFEPDVDHPGGCRPFGCLDAGSFVQLGSNTCTLDLGCSQPNIGQSPFLFVKAGVDPGGTGGLNDPLPTIQDALDRAAKLAPPAQQVHINLYQGTYAEGPLHIDVPVSLASNCGQNTVIEPNPKADPGPVIDIGPGGSGSSVFGLKIVGIVGDVRATAGIRVNGATNVTLGNALDVGPVAGPGVSFEDTAGETSGSLGLDGSTGTGPVVIHGAEGAGIALYGVSSFNIDTVQVIDTQESPATGRGVGILVWPSVSATDARLRLILDFAPSRPRSLPRRREETRGIA